MGGGRQPTRLKHEGARLLWSVRISKSPTKEGVRIGLMKHMFSHRSQIRNVTITWWQGAAHARVRLAAGHKQTKRQYKKTLLLQRHRQNPKGIAHWGVCSGAAATTTQRRLTCSLTCWNFCSTYVIPYLLTCSLTHLLNRSPTYLFFT